MSRRLLVVTAVEREAEACYAMDNTLVVAGGIGRTNAAMTTTRALLQAGPFDAVVSMGVAGALPGSNLELGACVLGTRAHYVEEGLVCETGFGGMDALGFSLGPFAGNDVEANPELLAALEPLGVPGPIATVATCSGTNEAAASVAKRSAAIAEAMEGAAVLHVAAAFGIPAIELRTISNTTGDRSQQRWDIEMALDALADCAAKLRVLL